MERTDGEILQFYIDKNNVNISALVVDLGMTRQNFYQLYKSKSFEKTTIDTLEKGLKKKFSDIVKYVNVNIGENISHNTLKEDEVTYLDKRRDKKNNKLAPPIPGFVGNTKMGKFEAYADDPDMQTPAGYFDSQIFPGCDHAEKVSGDSMYPLIVNQGWIIGKTIDKSGIISGEKYCLHLKSGQNIVKYVQWENKKRDIIKIISHNKKVPEDSFPINEITFCVRVYFIINPT